MSVTRGRAEHCQYVCSPKFAGGLFVVLALNGACQTPIQQRTGPEHDVRLVVHDPADTTVALRFDPPAGFSRPGVPEGGFGSYLRDLPLKRHGAPVLLYNGRSKVRQDVHAAVVELSVGDRDLQQCADAIMRLRAEFLFATGRQDEITFEFTSGYKAPWKRWRHGERITVEGNACRWVPGRSIDASHEQLLRYLDMVFSYAGTLSLERELARGPEVSSGDLDIGDIFIQGGSPGHAVIVVDKAVSRDGRVAFLLAQSYMPAQEIHVLKNQRHPEMDAWFLHEEEDRLYTPEWTFTWGDRRRWP